MFYSRPKSGPGLEQEPKVMVGIPTHRFKKGRVGRHWIYYMKTMIFIHRNLCVVRCISS